MKKSTLTLIIIGGFLASVAIAAGVVALGYFAVQGVSNKPPTEAQKRLVLNARSLERYEIELDPKCITLVAKRNLDMTNSIELEHECEGSNIYLVSTAEINPNVRGAVESYVISIGAYKTGVAISAGELQPRDDLLTLGDQHYAALIRNSGKPVGNVFVVRQGRVLHTLLVTGIYFDETEDVHDLFEPLLEESRRQFS